MVVGQILTQDCFHAHFFTWVQDGSADHHLDNPAGSAQAAAGSDPEADARKERVVAFSTMSHDEKYEILEKYLIHEHCGNSVNKADSDAASWCVRCSLCTPATLLMQHRSHTG